MKQLLALCLFAACARPQPAPPAFPVTPDSIYTNSGATPVELVETLIVTGPDSVEQVRIGEYDYWRGRVYIVRRLTTKQQRKVYEHERCHVILMETGLALHASRPFMELLCDAFASARVAELERSQP